MEICFPIFVRAKDSGEVYKFDSIYAAQYELEKTDVEDQEYEAWDRDGLPIELGIQESVWLKINSRAETAAPDQLRRAILEFASSVGVQFQDQLSTSAFQSALDQIRAEQEKQKRAKNPINRIFRRFKRD